MNASTDRIDRLEIDIDCRLADLWHDMDDVKEWTLEVAAAFMRASYGAGYMAALIDPPGKLLREHGYLVPARGNS